MIKKRIYKIVPLLIGILGIIILAGCHATQSGYLYDENYPYPYPVYYPYYYPHVFFGSDILIIQSDGVVTSPSSSPSRGRTLRSGSLDSGERGLSSSSSTGKRSLKR